MVTPAAAQERPRTPVRAVASVDLDRYLGEWFEIARFPNRFQRRCVGDVTASYARRPDGRLDVVNRCLTSGEPISARGVARILDDTGAKLKVRFAPGFAVVSPVRVGRLLDPGAGRRLLVGGRRLARPETPVDLSRTPALGDELFAQALAAARANGFDVDRLVRTPQGVAAAGPTRR